MSPIINSGDPLNPDENLFRECEIGLDKEITDYMVESHTLQIRIGGEPFYLFRRTQQGKYNTISINQWVTTSPQYSSYVWTPSLGEQLHPNTRIQQDAFNVFSGSTKLTRVFDKSSIAYNNEYSLEVEVGDDTDDAGSVRIWFNEGHTPRAISAVYRNICSCVDRTTGYPNRECPLCKGTSYPAAFIQYKNAATKYNPTNTVIVRVPMAAEELPVDQIGRVTRRDLRHWMPAKPYVNNYDIIIGTIGRNKGVVFEVVNKSDSRVRGILIHQEFNTVRIEESDIRYSLIPAISKDPITEQISITSNAYIV